jgi:hypothetical protein
MLVARAIVNENSVHSNSLNFHITRRILNINLCYLEISHAVLKSVDRPHDPECNSLEAGGRLTCSCSGQYLCVFLMLLLTKRVMLKPLRVITHDKPWKRLVVWLISLNIPRTIYGLKIAWTSISKLLSRQRKIYCLQEFSVLRTVTSTKFFIHGKLHVSTLMPVSLLYQSEQIHNNSQTCQQFAWGNNITEFTKHIINSKNAFK